MKGTPLGLDALGLHSLSPDQDVDFPSCLKRVAVVILYKLLSAHHFESAKVLSLCPILQQTYHIPATHLSQSQIQLHNTNTYPNLNMLLLPLSRETLPSALSQLYEVINPFATPQSQTTNTSKMSFQEQQDRRNARLQTLATNVLGTHAAFEKFGISPSTFPPATNCNCKTKATSEAYTKYMNAKNALCTEMIPDQNIHHLPTPTDLGEYIAETFGDETEPDNTVLQMCHLMNLDTTLCNKTRMIKHTEGKPEYLELHQVLEGGKWP
jgi:hypothetical protein